MAGISRAVELAGSQLALAKMIGMTPQAVSWAVINDRCSAAMAKAIHDATNGVVPKWELCPEIFDAPTDVERV